MNSLSQVPREHYFKGYDTEERWMSYWYQINEVLWANARKVLEVGIGNKTVSNYLKERGIKVTTVDINPHLKPDYVCSVIELTKCFKSNSFDVVLCAEVLEHLPFEYFEKALGELRSVARRYVILSLPYSGANFCVSLKLPLTQRMDLNLKVPYFFLPHKFNGEHYWEIGKKGYPLKKILNLLKEKFRIIKCYFPAENMYHIFFVLKK